MSTERNRKKRVLMAAFALAAIALLATPIKTIARTISPNLEAEPLSLSPTEACGSTSWDLTAGQHIDVGTVTVSNDAENIYVTYTLDDPDYPNAGFVTLHMWVGNDLTLVDGGGLSRPSPGKLPHHFNAAGLKTYTFQIPFTDLNIPYVTQACGTKLYVVTHAEVDLDSTDGDSGHETGFGGPVVGLGKAWWFYGEYAICCDFGSPQPPFCQTAFAKGDFVWTTDRKSNPEGLRSLNLTKNRWGWAINLPAPGTTTYDIWAGAGLNNTGNGVKVGNLTINWDGTTKIATVTYNMFTGYYLGEVHLYAGDGQPTTIAPGQYGYLDSLDPRRTTYTFNVPLEDTNGTGGVWIVAHAVVCNQL